MNEVNLEMYAGTSKYIVATIYGDDGNKLDLTNVTSAEWDVYANKHVTTSVLSKTLTAGITKTDPANGEITITLVPADTEEKGRRDSYYHRLKITNGGDTSIVLLGSLQINI